MPFIFLYLGLYFVAPHDWLWPFVGMRTDLFLYPAWLLFILAKGGGPALVRLGPQDVFLLCSVVWIVIGAMFNSFEPGLGPKTLFYAFNYAKWFIMFRLTVATVRTLPQVRAATFMILFYGVLLAFEGISHMNSSDGVGWAGQGFAWMDELAELAGVAGRIRWVGNFDGPGVFCVAYTVAIPVALVLVGKPYGPFARLFGLLMLVPLLLATYYTGSRGGFLATVGVIGLFIAVKWGISLSRIAIAGGVALAIFLVAPAHLVSTSDSHRSAQYRIEMWGKGIEMVSTYPVFGIGKGLFVSYTKKLIAHNSGIEIAGELGFTGFFFWVALHYLGFRNLRRAYLQNEDPGVRATMIALALSLGGYLLSSLFVTLEYELLYFIVALTAAVGFTLKEPPRFTLRDAAIVAGLCFAYLAGIKGVVMMYF